jgi:thiosulfate/3-mercaptopyruvate sulfurtransferase
MVADAAYPNGHLLWTPAQLQARLGDEKLALLDVRASHEVMAGIIPGAAHLDLYGVGLTRTTPELFEEWIHLMRSLIGLRGVGMDKTVVIYEENQTGTRVARAFWLLDYFGHSDVHVLDGGMQAWRDAGYAVTHEMRAPKPARLPIKPQPERFVSADDLAGLLGQDDVVPLDTRAEDEYTGRNTRGGPRGGTIPGSVHLEWVRYLDEQGRLKPAAELLALFEANGVTRDKRIVPF